MKVGFSLFLTLFFVSLSWSSQVIAQEEANYCYKPSKPLFLSTAKDDKRYADDMLEYQNCQQRYTEMRERAARIKKESDKNSQMIMDTYMDKHN